ncbi:MAG TPA: exosortase family protein XrtF [Leeuwenhoekiella sp.]|nr:exosortase family protein XrtF [Leeuwenhoekiella sp.]
MIELISKYKSVLRFILTFLGTYIILSMLYSWYLQLSDGQIYYPDYITHQVAAQCKWLLNMLGYNAQIIPHPDEAAMKLMLNDRFLARVVEGCNSLSIIILFWAFVLSFFNGWKKTLFFIFIGSIGIYVINIFRIAFLVVAISEYPQYTSFLHSIIFPAIIYGFVFVLWIYWIFIFKRTNNG